MYIIIKERKDTMGMYRKLCIRERKNKTALQEGTVGILY
jgi:hypothetical protein